MGNVDVCHKNKVLGVLLPAGNLETLERRKFCNSQTILAGENAAFQKGQSNIVSLH